MQSDEDLLEALQYIGQASDQMLFLLEDLLDLTAIEEASIYLAISTCELKSVVRRAISLQRVMAAQKQQKLLFNPGVDSFLVDIDSQRLTQVLNNLLSNAVKYSPLGSEIEVKLSRSEADFRIEVLDEGPGIEEDNVEMLFKPFGTLGARGTAGEKSIGLGLAIVKKIVGAHGGRVGVENRSSGGSCFYLVIPVHANPDIGPHQSSSGAGGMAI